MLLHSGLSESDMVFEAFVSIWLIFFRYQSYRLPARAFNLRPGASLASLLLAMSEPIDKHIPPAEAATTAEPVAPVAVPEASAEQPAPHENPTPTTTAAAPEPAAVTNTAAPEPVAKIQVVDGPEPSSPLYDKLTEADKAAVKSLRVRRPCIDYAESGANRR